jgi:viroplasmin and RNaseH domain-containing protein
MRKQEMTQEDTMKMELAGDKAMQNAQQSAEESASNNTVKLTATEAIEIGHSSDVLKRAYELVGEAYDLIANDEIARKYLDLDATVTWQRHIWNKITKAYDAEFNKDGKEVYHLRAFDAWKLQYPMCITTSGKCETSG